MEKCAFAHNVFKVIHIVIAAPPGGVLQKHHHIAFFAAAQRIGKFIAADTAGFAEIVVFFADASKVTIPGKNTQADISISTAIRTDNDFLNALFFI